MVVAMNPEHPLAGKDNLTLDDYQSAPCIVIDYHQISVKNDVSLDFLNYQGPSCIRLNQTMAAFFIVQRQPYLITTTGKYVDFFNAHTKNPLIVKSLPIDIDDVYFMQAWPKAYTEDHAHKWLRSMVKQVCKNLGL